MSEESHPSTMPVRNENMCPHKDVHTDDLSNISHTDRTHPGCLRLVDEYTNVAGSDI